MQYLKKERKKERKNCLPFIVTKIIFPGYLETLRLHFLLELFYLRAALLLE